MNIYSISDNYNNYEQQLSSSFLYTVYLELLFFCCCCCCLFFLSSCSCLFDDDLKDPHQKGSKRLIMLPDLNYLLCCVLVMGWYSSSYTYVS